ncbi:MAG: glycosyltransferase family 2 protein [Gaiellaceae bacterium]
MTPGGDWKFDAPVPESEVGPGERPSFSILIPAHQAEGTIVRAVESALAQTYPAKEIIVCDDGSTDGTDIALRPYRDVVRLLTKENGGAASARNAAAAAASGEFVAQLDADDAFDPRRLEALADLGRIRPDLDILVTDVYFVAGGRRTGRFYASNEFALDDQRTAILRTCFVGGWPAIRLSRLRELGGYDESLPVAHDWDAAIRLIFAGARAGLVDSPLMEYTLGASSLTSARGRSLEDRVRVLEKTLASPGLTPGERRTAEQSLRLHRRRAASASLDDAVRVGARGIALRVVTRRGAGIRTRAAAATVAVAPAPVQRLVARRRRSPA